MHWYSGKCCPTYTRHNTQEDTIPALKNKLPRWKGGGGRNLKKKAQPSFLHSQMFYRVVFREPLIKKYDHLRMGATGVYSA